MSGSRNHVTPNAIVNRNTLESGGYLAYKSFEPEIENLILALKSTYGKPEKEWHWGYINADVTYRFPYRMIYVGFPSTSRTDTISKKTKLKLANITFDSEQTKAHISNSTVYVKMKYYAKHNVTRAVTSHEKEILTVLLTGKEILTVPSSNTTTDVNTFVVITDSDVLLKNKLGDVLDTSVILGFTLALKITGLSSSGDPKVICTYKLIEIA